MNEIKKFYKGYSEEIINQKSDIMNDQSARQDYEGAGKTRDLIKHLESARETQVLMTTKKDSVDVVAINIGKYDVLTSCLKVRNGRVVGEIKKTSEQVLKEIIKILEDQKVGERIREGFKIAIVGPTNAGKSSLLNYLSKRDVAIVSEVAGLSLIHI